MTIIEVVVITPVRQNSERYFPKLMTAVMAIVAQALSVLRATEETSRRLNACKGSQVCESTCYEDDGSLEMQMEAKGEQQNRNDS